MVTKHQIKLIKSLAQKKYRQELGLFVVEGVKGVNEFLNSNFKLHTLYTTQSSFKVAQALQIEISETELKNISNLKNPNIVLGIFEIQNPKPVNTNSLILALDAVRDPGNLGTIIRLCDWYGIKDVVCTEDTVDCFNPKVVQATMGSLSRVNVAYTHLEGFISNYPNNSFGTFLQGENIYTAKLPNKGVLILGNEANGISEAIALKTDRKLTIPQFNIDKVTESLNVATATAICLSEFKRRSIEM